MTLSQRYTEEELRSSNTPPPDRLDHYKAESLQGVVKEEPNATAAEILRTTARKLRGHYGCMV